MVPDIQNISHGLGIEHFPTIEARGRLIIHVTSHMVINIQ